MYGTDDGMYDVIERSVKDPEFRRRLLADPKGTLAQESGLPCPAGSRVKVIEEDPDVFVLTIPKMPASASGELSDRELEMVAGGVFGTFFWCNTATYQIICRCQAP